MPLKSSPLAIDGARIDSANFRVESYMAGGRHEGVATATALKVTAAGGRNLRVAHGAGRMLNRYQATSQRDQAYAFSDNGGTTISSGQPPVSPSAQSYLVCAAIGDPEFSQVGHPFMPSSVPAEQRPTYQYVRYIFVPCSPTTTHFSQLNLNYPAYALARLDVPANASTFSDAMLTDLREIPYPRSVTVSRYLAQTDTELLNGADGVAGEFQAFPQQVQFMVDIPTWATRAILNGFVEGIKQLKAGRGRIRYSIAGATPAEASNLDLGALPAGKDFERVSVPMGGEISIPSALRGATARLRVEATPDNTASKGFLQSNPVTSGLIQVTFTEGVI